MENNMFELDYFHMFWFFFLTNSLFLFVYHALQVCGLQKIQTNACTK